MKIILFISLLIVIESLFYPSFGQVTFHKTYGGGGLDLANAVQQTYDGGYVVAGTSNSFVGPHREVWVIKTDVNGDTLWTKGYGSINDDFGQSIQQTADSGYIIVGYSFKIGIGDYDIYLIKIDVNGNLLWSRYYGGIDDDFGNSVRQTFDGGYIITGVTKSFYSGADSSLVYLIKTDNIGNILWSKTYGGGVYFNGGYSVKQTNDSGYIITGYTSVGTGRYDIYLIKTDTNGSIMWSKTYGEIYFEVGYDVEQTFDKGYVIVGYRNIAGYGDVLLTKTDSIGNLIWSKTYGGTDYEIGYCIQQTPDSGYILNGFTFSFGLGSRGFYLIKTDANGDTLWTKSLGGTTDDWGVAVCQSSDGGYFTAGYTSLGPTIYLIKTDANGNSGCNQSNTTTNVMIPNRQVTNPSTIVSIVSTGFSIPATVMKQRSIFSSTLCYNTEMTEIMPDHTVSISPNPFINEIKISSTANGDVILYDLTGKIILHKRILERETNINTENISSGLYFLQFTDGMTIEYFKLLKL